MKGDSPEITVVNDGDYESTTTPDLGGDGEPITAEEIIGETNPKSGLNLLEDVDIFNLLCIPSFNIDESPETEVTENSIAYIVLLLNYVKRKGRFDS